MAKLAQALTAAAGNAASALEIEYIASRSNVTDSRFVVWPNGTQVGDLVISFAGTIGRQYNPTGWTECFFYNGTFEINCRYKIMTAADISAGSVQLANVDHTWSALQLHTFRPSSALSNVYVNDSQAGRSSNGTSITITPTEQSPPHIILGGNLYYSANYPNMSGTFWDGKISSVGSSTLIRIQFAYEIQEDYSTSRTFSQTGTGNASYDELGGCYLSVE
jgi:hypothetical protein